MQSKKVSKIYNLVFPRHIDEMKIGGYRFTKVKNYKSVICKLHHVSDVVSSEYSTSINFGTPQITANVEVPKHQAKAALDWGHKNPTQLDDILLLISLFTQRDVFVKTDKLTDSIVRDCKKYCFGGQFSLSRKRIDEYINPETGKKYSTQELKQGTVPQSIRDLGFTMSLNDILTLISTERWKKSYGQGYFLFLFQTAMKARFIDIAFILCWTVWEHIFAIKNGKWMDEKMILNTSGANKIAFILSEYLHIEVPTTGRSHIERIARARNRLVHFGKKPDNVTYDEMKIFIYSTEQLIASLLGQTPSNVLSSEDKMRALLDGKDMKRCYSFHF